LSGASIDWITRMEQFENSIKQTNSRVKFIAVEPPIGPSGKQMILKQQSKVRIEAGAISSKSKNKEAIIRLYDYIYSEEGTRLMNWGIENVHYKMVNQKPEFTDLIMKDPDGKSPQIAMFSYGIARDWPRIIDKDSEDAMSSPAVREVRKLYEKFLGPAFPVVTFTNEEGNVDSSKGTAIRNYTMDGINKFIMGIEPISKFDEFAEKLYDMGIEEYISIHQSAYDRYINR